MGMQIEAERWEAQSSDAIKIAAPELAPGCSRDAVIGTDCPLSQMLYRDYRRYRAAGARNALSVIALTQGFWASAVFRVSHWMLQHSRRRPLRLIVKALCLAFQKMIEILAGICIPGTSNIGPGLYIGHFGNIFIDSDSSIGANCNIAQGVTIGKGGRGELHGVPVLGDRVHVGANAVLLGKINIGNDAVIGPGAIVMTDVPPCGVAMGNPARVIAQTGSFEFVNYDNMHSDPERLSALHSIDRDQNQKSADSQRSSKGSASPRGEGWGEGNHDVRQPVVHSKTASWNA